MLLPTFRADGCQHAAAAGFRDIKNDLANTHHFPGIFLPGGRAGHQQIRAKLFYAYAGRTAILQVPQRGLIGQQIGKAVGKGEGDGIVTFYPTAKLWPQPAQLNAAVEKTA